MKQKIVVYLSLMLLSLSSHLKADTDNSKIVQNNLVQPVTSSSLRQELDELKALYTTGSQEEQMLAVNRRIKFSGISSPELFDIAEKNILATSLQSTKRSETQYVAWMVQMLAFSGQEKYLPLLNSLKAKTTSRILKQHLTTSIEVLPKYKQWNTIIAQHLESVSASELNRARLVNMLNAADPELMRAGASIADHFYLKDEGITDLIEQRLLAIHKLASKKKDDEFAEASAWFCKVLGNTKNQKYLATLDLMSESDIDAIERWAGRAKHESLRNEVSPKKAKR